jgi:sulfite reductase alpha subunit-like flavoprotein
MEQKALFWELIRHQNGMLYICGYILLCTSRLCSLISHLCFVLRSDAKRMARDVNEAIQKIALEFGQKDGFTGGATDATEWVKGLKAEGRFLEDVWS